MVTNDIENLDPEEYEIKNKYSKNPFWKENNSVDDDDIEYWEYKKALKEYINKKEAISQIYKFINYKLNRFVFIFVICCMFLMYVCSIVCAFISIKDGQFSVANDITMVGTVFAGLAMYVVIELINLDKQFPLRKTKIFKDYLKNLKKNRKQIRKYAKSLVRPEKPGEWTFDDYFSD